MPITTSLSHPRASLHPGSQLTFHPTCVAASLQGAIFDVNRATHIRASLPNLSFKPQKSPTSPQSSQLLQSRASVASHRSYDRNALNPFAFKAILPFCSATDGVPPFHAHNQLGPAQILGAPISTLAPFAPISFYPERLSAKGTLFCTSPKSPSLFSIVCALFCSFRGEGGSNCRTRIPIAHFTRRDAEILVYPPNSSGRNNQLRGKK
jgi:hypothetical protein